MVVWEITYNGDNMPQGIDHTIGTTNTIVSFTYDYTNKRIKKSITDGATTYYIGDHYQVKEGTTTQATSYIFAGNLRIAKIKNGTPYYFHKDHLGSSSVMSDAAGNSVETTQYLPYGHERSHTGTNEADYMFTDQEKDKETKLYNYDAGLYDPVIGQFIMADTIVPDLFNPQSLNRYAYCLNNPLIYTDPTGHDFISLNDQSGANSHGHNGTLVGNKKDSWSYFSKDGYGKKTHHDFTSLTKFYVSDSAERYDSDYRVATTYEQD